MQPSAAAERRVSVSILVALLALLTSGCGTIYRHSEGARAPYSGVQFDAAGVGNIGEPALTVIFALDLPLSAVADTLLLPYDLTGDAE
jgi:uncharacterized protein YceK